MNIKRQHEQMILDRQWWDGLERLANEGDVAAFFSHYGEYLEANGIISKRRQILYTMALRAAAALKSIDNKSSREL